MYFHDTIRPIMTAERAAEVKQLRCEEDCTWRMLAARLHKRWPEADWEPASNQLAGIGLCEVAGELLGEDGTNW